MNVLVKPLLEASDFLSTESFGRAFEELELLKFSMPKAPIDSPVSAIAYLIF